MCTCNTGIFKYTNLTTEFRFEKCGRTKENLVDTPKNKTCAGVWIPSKKTPCGMMRVFDKERNLLFEGKETDYFMPKMAPEKLEEKLVNEIEIIETKKEKRSPITAKWLERYNTLKNEDKPTEYVNTYVHPIEGYSDMTPREKMIARLKLPRPKYKKKEDTSMNIIWEEMKEEGEYDQYCCSVLVGIFSKELYKSEIKKVSILPEKEELPTILETIESDEESEEEEEEEEEEWSEEEEEEEEEETGIVEDFGEFAISDETPTIDF